MPLLALEAQLRAMRGALREEEPGERCGRRGHADVVVHCGQQLHGGTHHRDQQQLQQRLHGVVQQVHRGLAAGHLQPQQQQPTTAQAPTTKAADPARLLLRENGHLMAPNRRPTMSASPSPTAIWVTATTPTADPRKGSSVASSSTTEYSSGPCSASFLSPLLETAWMSSLLPLRSVEGDDEEGAEADDKPAIESLSICNNGIDAAKNFANGDIEYKGQ
eukprot:CAMPEP_0170088888 /NCGR_PEP_ID=MMETSP0019_2-20121128/23071_1 /TAXON_ID=98059 /ORGANISM="Dinobryon sp., Strain UTEXLB2267" /LENGTH=218 /DNA_ID=CAMNT_0010307399 /DNA_START=439 /DNA_END=1096 /DNA_ORIENTATION=-